MIEIELRTERIKNLLALTYELWDKNDETQRTSGQGLVGVFIEANNIHTHWDRAKVGVSLDDCWKGLHSVQERPPSPDHDQEFLTGIAHFLDEILLAMDAITEKEQERGKTL